jgi:hypothetical protein
VKAQTLTLGDLNRATLARQMLLGRQKTATLRAVEALVGLQAQVARPPFVGLWTRVEGFRREDLLRLLHGRKVVRATAMRGTLHLVSARDFVALRPALQPMLSQGMRSVLRGRATGFDLDRVVAAARACFEEGPCTFDVLRPRLARAFPKGDARAMAYAARLHLPLVQVPTDAAWGFPAAADFAVAETWLGRKFTAPADPALLVLRYLAAFGPATVADAQTWSGYASLREAFERLRPRLRVLRDERGRELFDLAKAPRPPARTRAPVRFLPDFDNLVLAHHDRTRLVAPEHRPALATRNLLIPATFLVDGMVAGTWRAERARRAAALTLEAFEAPPASARAALVEEGGRLLRFVEGDAASHEVRFARGG